VVRDNLVLPSKISEMNGSINQAIVIAWKVSESYSCHSWQHGERMTSCTRKYQNYVNKYLYFTRRNV
jgi:hypothetical protein